MRKPTANHRRVAGIAALFGNRTVGTKVLSLVLFTALVTAVLGVLSLGRISDLNDRMRDLDQRNVRNLGHVEEIRRGMMLVYDGDTGLASWAGKEVPPEQRESVETAKRQLTEGDAVVDQAIASYRKDAKASPERQQRLEVVTKNLHRWRAMRDLIFLGVPFPEGIEAFENPYPLNAEVSRMLNELAALERAEAKASASEGARAYSGASRDILVTLGLGLLIAISLAWLTTRSLSRRLARVTQAVRGMGDGDLTQRVDDSSRDEVGKMASAVTQANENLRKTVRTLADSATALASSSKKVSGVSDQIAHTATETSSRASKVATAAELVSSDVHSAAAGGEEMGASIAEIARSANDGNAVAARAVSVAQRTNETVHRLGTSSAEIDSVIQLINTIAQQTNLLALNATIEAARAGDAGKGFAVVAGEVKDLAQETARATQDISSRISAIQSDTDNAVGAIGEITEIINQLNDYQLTIASAVEEQSSTTNEIARSVSSAAEGSAGIAGQIAGLADTARLTERGAADNQQAANELDRLSADLRTLVSQFRY
jgi:methyl-accepting chemotaxis protein